MQILLTFVGGKFFRPMRDPAGRARSLNTLAQLIHQFQVAALKSLSRLFTPWFQGQVPTCEKTKAKKLLL